MRVGIALDPGFRECAIEHAYDNGALVEELIRSAVRLAGLACDASPKVLADAIQPGSRVLINPNWVLDSFPSDPVLRTNDRFLLAVLEHVLAASPSSVIIGDAPVQGAQWYNLLPASVLVAIERMCTQAGASFEIVDFRQTVAIAGAVREGMDRQCQPYHRYLQFDLGADSLMEEVSDQWRRFRVTSYDPRELLRYHRPGRHQYLLSKVPFEVDAIISCPKVKLHRKTGLTGALKNCIGLIGEKECLPHHRRGGTRDGGDCYSGRSWRLSLAETLIDQANRRQGRWDYSLWQMGSIAARWPLRPIGDLEGSWWGNDTCWRMVLDVNRILRYGRSDGTMANEPQRQLLFLSDAIICGQGEGPLHPDPIAVGAVTCSDDPVAADMVHAALLGVDWRRLALIREALRPIRWPLTLPACAPIISVNGDIVDCDRLADDYGVRARPPRGWQGHMELEGASGHRFA